MNSILKDKNLSKTKFREELINIFTKRNFALSQKEIEDELGDFDRITLYRTLKLFQEKEVLHCVNIHDEKKYALCKSDCSSDDHVHMHDHLHLYCKKCKNVFCVELKSNFPQVEAKNVQIDHLEIQATGICENCTKSK